MYDEPDDDLPPRTRPGVTPVWRLIAIFSLIAAGGLLFLAGILLIILAEQGNNSWNNGWAVAPPMAAPAVVVGADVAVAEEQVVQGNLPYPQKQDLRPEGSFPLPGDAGQGAERPAATARQEFRKAAALIWTNSDPEPPESVLVSPDKEAAWMAYVSGSVLWAGPLGAPEAIGENGPAGGRPFGPGMGAPGMAPGGMGGGGMGGMMAGGASVVFRGGDHPRARLGGWSLTEPARVFWSDASGRILSYTPDGGHVTRTPLRAECAVPLAAGPADPDQLLTISLVPTPKIGGDRPAGDLTEMVARDIAGAVVRHPGLGKTLRPEYLATPALAPDGKRLALVEGKEVDGRRQWRAVVSNLQNGSEVCASPTAARYAGVCWSPDAKAIIYARSQTPVPANHVLGLPKNACDLYRFDVATKAETRLSRGGGFSSPSVTKAGQLYFLSTTPRQGAPPTVELLSIKLTALDEFLQDQEAAAAEKRKHWLKLAAEVIKDAGVPDRIDTAALSPERLKKIATAFSGKVEKAGGEEPEERIALERQRDEVARLALPPADQERFVVLLGAADGEFLRGQNKQSSWLLAKGPLDTAVRGENPFAVAFNPFRPLKSGGDTASLAEVLFRAEGRPLILSNDPAAVKEALENWADADLARGAALLQKDKGDEADRVLLDLVKRHPGNYYLIREVATLLQEHGRGQALARLLEPLSPQLPIWAVGDQLPRDSQLFNLIGIAVLDTAPGSAITAFQYALRCDLKNGPAYLNLAQACEQAHRRQDARLVLRRYLKLFPKGDLAEDARRRLRGAGDDAGP